jgi:hypothetical protein
MSMITLEERVSKLEDEIKQLKQAEPGKEQEVPRGWKRVVGIFADTPEFDEVVRYGREWRESQPPPGDASTS